MGYEFLEEEATADIAFEAWGDTLEELFTGAGAAMTRIMVDNPDQISEMETRTIEHEEPDVEQLLMRFMEDIIFYKDAERLVFSTYTCSVEQTGDGYRLAGTLQGDRFDPEEHVLGTNPKAVSWHHYTVEETGSGEWRCHVIVDV